MPNPYVVICAMPLLCDAVGMVSLRVCIPRSLWVSAFDRYAATPSQQTADDPNFIQAQCCSTSEVEWELMFPTWQDLGQN